MKEVFNFIDREQSTLDFRIVRFPDGHTHIDLQNCGRVIDAKQIDIKMRLVNGDDLFILMQLMSFLEENSKRSIKTLIVPYLMASRYDRKMYDFDSFDLKVVAEKINQFKFDKVVIYEPHSPVAVALIDNAVAVSPLDPHIAQMLREDPNIVLVAPDLGAVKRLETFVIKYKVKNDLLLMNKKRDRDTGAISNVESLTPFNTAGKKYLIYDDLCDGGATFLFAAQYLRSYGAETVMLAVTHSIFSKGLDVLLTKNDRGLYLDKIITTDSYKEHAPYNKLVVLDVL